MSSNKVSDLLQGLQAITVKDKDEEAAIKEWGILGEDGTPVELWNALVLGKP